MGIKELNLYDTIYPVYYLSKLVGLVYFKITGKAGNEQLTSERIYVIIIQLIYLVSPIIYGIYLLTQVQSKHDVGTVVFKFQAYSSLPVTIIIFVSFLVNRQLIISSIMDLIEVDRTLKRMGVTVSYKNARRFALIEILFFTAIFLWKAVLQLYSSNQVLVIVYSVMNIFGFINTISLCQYFNFVFLMRQRYVWIKRKLISLRKIINNNEIDPAFLMYPNDFMPVKRTTVSKIHISSENMDALLELQLLNKMHNTLHNVAVKISRAYSVQLLFIIAMRYLTILTQLLNAYKIINHKTGSKKSLVNNILTVVYFLLHAMKIFAICSISASTAEKSKENSEEILEIFSHNKDLKRNVNNFATRMLLQDTQFDCCGFFKLDYVLIYNIVGATTTYLIILIQFENNATQSLKTNVTVS